MRIRDEELAALYDRYGHVVHHRCYSILGNEEEAWDAVQETFARVLKHSDGFRRQASPLTWMYRISTNYCLNQLRNRKGRANKLTVHREDIVGDGASHPPEVESADLDAVRALLAEVDEETRACVVYTYFDDCTREEVAELVGLSVPTVRKRVNDFLDRARRALVTAAVALLALVVLYGSLP